MAVISNIVGGTTPTAAVVVARVDSGADVRVRVSTSPDGDPIWFGPVAPAEPIPGHYVARVDLTGLAPDTRYWWQTEHDGVLDETFPGEVRTHPPVGQPASYTVAVIGDAGLTPTAPGVGDVRFAARMSNHEGFLRVAQHPSDPLMVCHLGDVHYYNPGDPNWSGSDLEDYLRAWDDVLLQPNQHTLYRTRATQIMWDDHDYGRNDSDGTQDGKENAAAAYRARVPHHTLALPDGSIYHAFEIGRVLYVSSDTRYNRTPNSAPDNAAKTYLGATQKLWLRNLLASTTAQAMVWLMPNPWLGTLDDTWGGFTAERAELANMLTTMTVPASGGTRSWAASTVMVAADVHAIGHWSASANPWGRFPGMLCASIDATPSAAGGGQYDLGFRGGRDQYGTVGITDTGESITITMTAWTGNDAWGTQSVTIDAPYNPGPGPGPGPDPDPELPVAPPVIAAPAIRDHVTWLGVHRSTGRIIAELPDITGEPSRILSAYASSEMTIPITRGGPGHVPIPILEACVDGRSGALVAIVNDLPLWMGLPTVERSGSASTMRVGANTPESYLMKRLVRDLSADEEDRALVALALARQAEALDGQGQGLGLEYEVTLTGEPVTIDYLTGDRQWIYNAIRDLCLQGLEFEIALDWTDNRQTGITKILRIARRIGRVVGTPKAMFETGDAGSVTGYDLTRSWAERDYANHVTMLGPGQGDDQPVSDPVIDTAAWAAGVPIVESVVTGGNNLTTPELLQTATAAEASRVRYGGSTLDIEAQLNGYPRLGVDALLGDQVSYRLESARHPAPSPDDPVDRRLIGERRMTAWKANPAQGRWRPSLVADPELEVAGA